MTRHFSSPPLLWALVLLPLLSLTAWWAARRRTRDLLAYGGLVIGSLLARRRPSRLTAFCSWLGLVLLIVGMAGPRWGRDWGQSAAPGRDLVVVLDLSRSMFAEAPTRVAVAKDAALKLADTLAKKGGHRVALVVFAGRAELVCPLTHDLQHFREAVEAIDPSGPDPALGQGTRIGAAIRLAAEALEGRAKSARDIVLLSDGDDPARDGEYLAGAQRAAADNVPVHCVGVGDPHEKHRVPLETGGFLKDDKYDALTRFERGSLRDIATRTRGRYHAAEGRDVPLGDLWATWSAEGPEDDSPDALPVLKGRQVYFLLPAFVFLLVSLFLPERARS